MRRFKFIPVMLAAALLSLTLLTSCGPARNPEASSSAPEIVWTETDQWPDNEFTRLIPAPEAGTVISTAQGQSQDYDFFAVLLQDVSQEEADGYVQSLKDDGFLLFSENTETPKGGSLVVGSLFQKGDTSVSFSFSGDSMGLYIALPQKAA